MRNRASLLEVNEMVENIWQFHGKKVAPANHWDLCNVVLRLSRQANKTPESVWDELVYSDEYYSMPSIYAVVDLRGRTKIGKTAEPKQRLIQLQTGNADKLDMVGFVRCLPMVEAMVHRHLDKFNIGGEWFKKHAKVARVVDMIVRKDVAALYNLLGVRYLNPEG